jgi:hypothetical protein
MKMDSLEFYRSSNLEKMMMWIEEMYQHVECNEVKEPHRVKISYGILRIHAYHWWW